MRIQISHMYVLQSLALCFTLGILTLDFAISDEATSFRLIQREGDSFILETSAVCSPGTIIAFNVGETRAYLTIYRRQQAGRYMAKASADLNGESTIQNLAAGAVGTTNTLLQAWKSQPGDSPSDYWLRLKNPYLFGPTEWLTLENGKDLKEGKLARNMPFLLSLRQPSVGGYICLLSPEAEGRVVVFFPNTRPGSTTDVFITKGTSENNLTYDARKAGQPVKTALLNIGARAGDPGPTHFVVLLSQEPRPISDFLPSGHGGRYVDWQGQSIHPWEIGPGFLKRGASHKEYVGVDYLAGDEWGISKLTIDVAQ